MGMLRGIFGSREGRRLERYERRLREIERLGGQLGAASDAELQARAGALRQRAAQGASLDSLLVEAFAVAREASGRVLAMRHFDVQLVGAMALHEGLIAEMKTGEGKTLAATLPAFLNALGGGGVHVVTVNDYLAERDAAWMGPLYRFLGLDVGVILEAMDGDGDAVVDELDEAAARRRAYAADVTYGTNHEIAFDYLRDNLSAAPDEVVHRGFDYAIVDEVDFLLIDEARTPLIISAPAREEPGLFERVDRVVRKLQAGMHFIAETKTKRASLTDRGLEAVQRGLDAGSLIDPDNLQLYHAVCQAVIAHGAYQRDVDYIVDGGRVFIVDEFTGRVSEDKRFADGLHQALEAKEGVAVRAEDQTVAKVTYQTFFGRYRKLAGMTGTAWPEREELRRTYGLDVVRVPTHRPMIREDYEDEVFISLSAKHRAMVDEIGELRAAGRPVLVGSTSVRESEQLSRSLTEADVPHEVLNAKNHRAEAAIIAQAGRRGAVTISTNMAGRGTDIVLGGSLAAEGVDGAGAAEVSPRAPGSAGEQAAEQAEVVAAGGLHVIGTAHHEAVRIDDQLRGRAGRQGDPGSSQFIVSIDDEIYRKFGTAEIDELRRALRQRGHPPEAPVPYREVRATLLGLQRKVDEENRGIRREVLRYDIVLHQQRESLYAWRAEVLDDERFSPEVEADELVDDVAARYGDDPEAMAQLLGDCFGADFELPGGDSRVDHRVAAGVARARELMQARASTLDAEAQLADRALLRGLLLSAIDDLWTDHLGNLERLEEGIGMRGYAQLDPLVEWRREAGLAWNELLLGIRLSAFSVWSSVDPTSLR